MDADSKGVPFSVPLQPHGRMQVLPKSYARRGIQCEVYSDGCLMYVAIFLLSIQFCAFLPRPRYSGLPR